MTSAALRSTVAFSSTIEFALALSAAADDAADARGELAPDDRARHDVGGAELERQHLLDQVGAAGNHDEARTGLAGMPPEQIEAGARRIVFADDGDIDAAAESSDSAIHFSSASRTS